MANKSDTRKLKAVIKALRKMQGGKISWGFDDTPHPNGRGADTMGDVARLVEMGHVNGGLFPNTYTPARPFFQSAVDDSENHRRIRAIIKRKQRDVLQAAARNKPIALQAKMDAIGEELVRQVRESLDNYNYQVADTTIAMREWRGFTSKDPLKESGSLYDGVTFSLERFQ